MTGEERARILRMVADGKVSPVEAEDLLAALDPAPRAETRAVGVATSASRVAASTVPFEGTLVPRALTSRNLVLRIEGADSKVNLRIPLGIARAAGRFLPRRAQESLASYSIDLEHILESLGAGSEEGTLLEIEDGDDHVRIAVE